MTTLKSLGRLIWSTLIVGFAAAFLAAPASAADSVKVGFSMALTGPVSPNGKQLLLAIEIWRDDINA